MSNSSRFGGSFLRCNNPQLACLFPAANLQQKFPPFPGGGEGTGDLGYTSWGWGDYFGSLPPCLQIAASNVTSYKTLESFLSL